MKKGNAVVQTENTETANNVMELKIPRMAPIKTVAKETGLSYKTLWKLCKQERIVYVRTGNKYLINFDRLIDYLNTGEQHQGA